MSDETAKFITALFGPTTEMPVHFCSLGNERDGRHTPKFVTTRDLSDIAKFVAKWDQPERGMFFCVGTIKPGAKREKAGIGEIAALHADIDFKSISTSPDEARAALSRLECPPTIVVASGNGLHAYWLLTEGLDAQVEMERLEAALRQLADTVGGDIAVCEIARLMRLPGTHNTKRGEFVPVSVEILTDRRYELDDIEEWLARTSPKILRKDKPAGLPADDNPFLTVARQLGFKPTIDVEKRLAAMSYGGVGETSIHQTQLAVSASLLNQGTSIEEVVSILLTATKGAAGEYGQRWNWRREEKALLTMCQTWLKKHPQQVARPLSAAAVEQSNVTLAEAKRREAAANGTDGKIVDLGSVRKERTKKKKERDAEATTVVADGVIEAIRRAGQDIMLSEGEVWIYADGIWHVMTTADQQWIMTLIQEGFEALNEPMKTTNLNASYKRLTEHPGLYRRTVAWASGEVIVCQNGVLRIDDRTFHPHGPQWFARRKIGAAYVPGSACPQFETLLSSMFADRPPAERAGFVNTIQSFAGAALAIGHLSREERKALILVGPSRTGKTELSRIIRLLIGDPIATPSVAEISERFGLASLYDAAAWIRDDAINEGDDLDPQRFKTIVTGEPIDIERKHKPAVPGVELALPVLLTTNSLPRARDKSDAIFNRALVLEMTNVVSEAEAFAMRSKLSVPRGMTAGQHIFGGEAPGILNWALAGLDRLLSKGAYELPESVRTAIQRFKDDNNPVGEWARTAIVKAPHGKVSRADLMCAYHGWQREQDGDEARAFGARGFFPRLRSAAPWVGDTTDPAGRRYITGVQLSDEGLQLWDLHNQGPQLKGGSKGTSLTKLDVNRSIPTTPETTNFDPSNRPAEANNAPRF